MQDYKLRQLHQRTIALEMSIANRKCVVKGIGQFDAQGELGPALRVGISDPSGNFEILLKESQWNGRIQTGEHFSCDFAVQLDATCVCSP